MRTDTHFEALRLTLVLIRALRLPLKRLASVDADLARQARRAATSIALQLAEGSGSAGGNPRRYYRYAHASARETRQCIGVALAWGYMDQATADRLDALADKVCALTYGLTR